MSPESEKRSSDRKKQIIEHSNEVLSNMPHTYGTQSFIVSENEARAVGAAISERDHRAINDLFGDAMTAAVEDYASTNADECIGVWNQTIAGVYGEGVNLHEMLENQSNRELLNIMLTSSEHNQLGLETTEYLKLIETIAILTMPDNGFSTYPSSRQSRVGGSERALFLRSLTLLNSCADAEPGMRSIREGVLNTDKNALNKYLSSTIKANSAKSSLETIIEMDEHEIRRQKAGLERIVLDERSEHDIEVGDLLHVLDWHLLSEKEDRDSRHKRIKAIIEGQAKTERQKRQLYTDWCPERLDFLIEIAERGITENRDPKMYISNRFEEGAGVYVSVELSNPADNNYKILFADNPLSGNALYIVDELKLENEGRPNNWLNVLGASRRIARERGAIRKYHTKNWQDILPSIMNMGARHEVVSTAAPELSKQPSEIETVTDRNDTNFESLLKRHKALIDAARQLLS